MEVDENGNLFYLNNCNYILIIKKFSPPLARVSIELFKKGNERSVLNFLLSPFADSLFTFFPFLGL